MRLKSQFYFKVILVIVGLVLSSGSNADVEVRPLRTGYPESLILSGRINKSDVAELTKLLPQYKIIWLNSPGGDVSAAMDIGRLLRRFNSIAMVDYNQVCVSACVLVLAGSTFRMIKGKVGIHRPYLPEDNATTEEEQKVIYDTIRKNIKNHLEIMNINPTLYDDMFRISPRNVKFLDKEELDLYGLSGTDPYFEEAASAREAKELQISKEEFFKRKNQQDECIRFFDISRKDMAICRMAAIYGLSMDEYVRRSEIAEKECGNREADKFKWRDCEERIVRGF
jgi:hypothetical protein